MLRGRHRKERIGGVALAMVFLIWIPLLSFSSAEVEMAKELTIDLPELPPDAKKLEMVLILPGTFFMGSPHGEPGRSERDWSVHHVTITRPFYMSKYEVTQAQWETLMHKNPSKFRGRPNHPVEKVSWRACQKFIKRLKDLDQGTFRLPTEVQWEYACRADTQTPFFFSDEVKDVQEGDNFFEVADRYMWWAGNSDSDGAMEVGLKSPNPWGFYDMHGNVWEWCWDRWEKPYQKEPQVDPQGPPFGWSFFSLWRNHVGRGGSFRESAEHCRSAHRGREQSFDYHYSLGFRLVREYP
jgi:formylglycine-generating enzyme required for sulfatase activity